MDPCQMKYHDTTIGSSQNHTKAEKWKSIGHLWEALISFDFHIAITAASWELLVFSKNLYLQRMCCRYSTLYHTLSLLHLCLHSPEKDLSLNTSPGWYRSSESTINTEAWFVEGKGWGEWSAFSVFTKSSAVGEMLKKVGSNPFKEILTQGHKIYRMKQHKQNQVEVAITVK